MLLIYESEAERANMSEAARGEEFQAYMKYTQELKDAKAFIAGDPLESISTATSVRVRSGETLHTDGPFAETKEQLGGYYLVECDNLDEALKWAAKCPAALQGTMEVRPVMTIPDM